MHKVDSVVDTLAAELLRGMGTNDLSELGCRYGEQGMFELRRRVESQY
ncbi:hypothetical protein [Mycobacterium lepromatosis]|nr:hypothetical protein [Mycobacterium lepromatosis]